MDLQGLAAAAALMSTDAVAAGGASSAAAAAETAGPAGQRRSTRRRNLVTTAATSAAAGGAAASAAAVSSPAGRKRAAAPALTEGATDDKALSTTISSSNSYSTGGNNAGKGREKGSKSKGEESSSSMTASAVDSSIVNSSGSSCKRRRVAASTEQSQGQQSQQRQDAEHSNGDGTMIADAAGPGVMGEQVAAGDDDNQNRGILNNEDLAASAALQSFTSDSRNTSITSPTQPTTPLSADGVAGLGAEEGQASKDGAAATVAGSSSAMEGRGSSDSENRGIFEAHPQVLPLLPPELTRAASAAVSPVVADPGVSKSGLAASSSSRGSAGGAGHLSAASVQQNGATSTQNSAGISAGAISFMPGITNQPTSASYAAPSAASAPSQSAYSHYQPAADLPHQQELQQPAWSPSDLLSSYKLPPIPVPHSGDTAVPSSSSLSAGSAFPPGPSTYHHEPLPYGDLHYPIEDSLAGLDQQSSHQLPPPPLQYSHQSGSAPEQQEQQQQQSHEQLYQQNFADGSVASEAAAPLVPAKKQKGRRPNLQTGEAKNHRCSFEGCEWAFSRREHLKRHEKTHTQDRVSRLVWICSGLGAYADSLAHLCPLALHLRCTYV